MTAIRKCNHVRMWREHNYYCGRERDHIGLHHDKVEDVWWHNDVANVYVNPLAASATVTGLDNRTASELAADAARKAGSPGIGGAPTRCTILPVSAEGRKRFPIQSGALDYFPDALAAMAALSWIGNHQHNPGQPLHWARSKSADEADTLQRHQSQRGTLDDDPFQTPHSVKVLWRAAAQLQKEIEENRAMYEAWVKRVEGAK